FSARLISDSARGRSGTKKRPNREMTTSNASSSTVRFLASMTRASRFLSPLFTSGLGCQDHEIRRDVGSDHEAGWADTRGRQQGLVTIASRDVEDSPARTNTGKL